MTQSGKQAKIKWPLMRNNMTKKDRRAVIRLFSQEDPKLTQGPEVRAFEEEWSRWLGVKYGVFVNSGSSANILTMAALKHFHGGGEVIVPPLTWVSDITSVIYAGLKPVFADINPRTLGMDTNEILNKITPRTKAVFLTHVLGYNALTNKLIDDLKSRKISLIEDVCESHGTTFKGRKAGTFGEISNFSFYYGHHMSTIEGGMVCTNDSEIYNHLRMLRGHAMVREYDSPILKEAYKAAHPDLNPDFIFAHAGYNMRNTEVGAVIGRSQLKRLDANNVRRAKNLKTFLDNLDSAKYFTDFDTNGNSNYAFTLVSKKVDPVLWANVEKSLRHKGIEFRRGLSGGGNQMRQPYLVEAGLAPASEKEYAKYPNVEHVHSYGCYIGNYPSLKRDDIMELSFLLNKQKGS